LEKISGEKIRRFLVEQVEAHPEDIAKVAAKRFGITRQAVHRHLKVLLDRGVLEATGQTRRKRYALKVEKFEKEFSLRENADEDRIWRTFVEPHLTELPSNVSRICQYGFTEMFNNAIEHSEGTLANVIIKRSISSVKMLISDNGIGIFEKIKERFGLEDHRHAILELAKGKLTTDPSHHSGEGIFFGSRMFDEFAILSGKLIFIHNFRHDDDWLIEDEQEGLRGTAIVMEIAADSPRTLKEVFDRYADPEVDDYAFSKTHVPLSLAQYGQDQLVSRSQARRVLARFERFREVYLDFTRVEFIGQAFADEIFRVFAAVHPDIKLVAVNTNEDVTRMIGRARALAKSTADNPSAGT
jgi:DNA-binding transcriptional ArsR family regulator